MTINAKYSVLPRLTVRRHRRFVTKVRMEAPPLSRAALLASLVAHACAVSFWILAPPARSAHAAPPGRAIEVALADPEPLVTGEQPNAWPDERREPAGTLLPSQALVWSDDGDLSISRDALAMAFPMTDEREAPSLPSEDERASGTNVEYWMSIRAAIASELRWPAAAHSPTSVVLRLRKTPYGFFVAAPPPGGDPCVEAVRDAARRAMEQAVARPLPNTDPEAELTIRFVDETPETKRRSDAL